MVEEWSTRWPDLRQIFPDTGYYPSSPCCGPRSQTRRLLRWASDTRHGVFSWISFSLQAQDLDRDIYLRTHAGEKSASEGFMFCVALRHLAVCKRNLAYHSLRVRAVWRLGLKAFLSPFCAAAAAGTLEHSNRPRPSNLCSERIVRCVKPEGCNNGKQPAAKGAVPGVMCQACLTCVVQKFSEFSSCFTLLSPVAKYPQLNYTELYHFFYKKMFF